MCTWEYLVTGLNRFKHLKHWPLAPLQRWFQKDQSFWWVNEKIFSCSSWRVFLKRTTWPERVVFSSISSPSVCSLTLVFGHSSAYQRHGVIFSHSFWMFVGVHLGLFCLHYYVQLHRETTPQNSMTHHHLSVAGNTSMHPQHKAMCQRTTWVKIYLETNAARN